jgi:hypothetical protein
MSPVKIGFGGKISVKGVATPIGAMTKVSFAREQLEVEQAFRTEFGTVKFKEQVRPGQLSKIGVELGKSGFPLSIELAANADYTRPFSVSVKWPGLIQLNNFKLSVAGVGIGQGWVFRGTLDPQIDINIAMNEAWPGWANILRLSAYQVRAAVQGGATFVRSVYFVGECGMVSTAGVAATAGLVGAFVIGWAGFGLYMVGQASRDGRTKAVRYAFSNGYARMLADLTSDSIETTRNDAVPLLALDWKSELGRVSGDYVNGKRFGLGDQIERLGKAAIVQDADAFIKAKGTAAWAAVRQKHHNTYGIQTDVRRRQYLSVLYNQVDKHSAQLGIAL